MAGHAFTTTNDQLLKARAPRISRRDRVLALVLGVSLHSIILAAILLTGSAALLRGAQMRLGDGEAVEVTLSGWEGAAARARHGADAPPTPQSQLDKLLDRLRAANSPLYVTEQDRPPPGGSLASLFDPPSALAGKGTVGAGKDAAGRQQDGGVRASTALSSLVGDGASGDSGGGGLWRQIEPCWSRLPLRSAVPVTLEVSLNGAGRLAKPPRILRPSVGRPDEQRLVAEARALQAISACLPYGGAEGLGRTQTVSFPGSHAK